MKSSKQGRCSENSNFLFFLPRLNCLVCLLLRHFSQESNVQNNKFYIIRKTFFFHFYFFYFCTFREVKIKECLLSVSPNNRVIFITFCKFPIKKTRYEKPWTAGLVLSLVNNWSLDEIWTLKKKYIQDFIHSISNKSAEEKCS